ncbi:MAG: hypothetical protein AB7F09_03595 [Parvibaculaceae bacterium]
MPNLIAIAGILAIVVIGLGVLVLRILSRRNGYDWQLSYRAREPNMLIRQSNAAVWLTDKSTEERHEEHRDYLRERAKNDRHQDLD